ncbi:hypothetical protein LPTSP4_05080 [Leptospira ryugenii]|uniref:Haem-binding domain-containing protein n=1 Tax=Leptospira ryugenii TaxID=1917863 RepID=A0A2P2DWI8_9LEPT|nr:heme-binding domain-containing protein [Leptospira ryugenii]GBF49001.1 hypothetical protein LPTSP4_05080 [Leptospira ryugenii]
MKLTLAIVGFLLFAIQWIPVDRSQRPEPAPLEAEPEIKSILERSCFDCHSNRSQWPFYSYISPISLFVERHIQEGREELNFSEWESLSLKKKATYAGSIRESIEEGEMPLFSYTILHRNAILSETDRKTLIQWTERIENEYDKESE